MLDSTANLLLLVEANLLQGGAAREFVSGLPGGNTDVRNTSWVGEDGLDVLEGLTGGLGEHEKYMNEHGSTEDTEDDVDLPLDVLEGRGDEPTQSEVEGPVEGGAQSVGLATDTQGEELGRVHPRGRTPGDGVGGDEQVGTRNDSLGRRAGDFPGLCGCSIETAWGSGMTVCGHQTSIGVQPGRHEGGTNKESGTATPAIQPQDSRDGHEHIDHILDTGRHQKVVTIQTGHRKHIRNVVHHHVHARKLGPDLREDTDVSAVDHVRLEEFHEAHVGILTFKFAHALDLLEFALDKRRVRVTVTMNQGKDSMALLPTVLAGEPTGRLRKQHHSKEKKDSRNHLQTPGNPERGGALDKAASIGNATEV